MKADTLILLYSSSMILFILGYGNEWMWMYFPAAFFIGYLGSKIADKLDN